MELDLTRMRCFAEVAERGTVSAAATALDYSGPAVSQQLAKLESELGTKLFDRAGGRLRLSDAGHRLLPHALHLLATATEVRQVLREPIDDTKPIELIGFPSALSYLVAPALSLWEMTEWHAPIVIKEAEDALALRELRLGHADVAIIQEYSHTVSARDKRFTYTLIGSDPLVAIASSDAPVAPGASLEDLSNRSWIISGQKTPCELATTQACIDAGFEPEIVAEVTDNTAVLALVAAGAGVALVPQLVLSAMVEGVVPLPMEIGITRDIYAVHRNGAHRPALGEFIETLQQTLSPR